MAKDKRWSVAGVGVVRCYCYLLYSRYSYKQTHCSLPPGQPSNPLDGCRQLVELKTLSQRNFSVEERAVKIQRDVVQHAKELDARDPRNRVHAELMSYGIGGQYVALVVGPVLASSQKLHQIARLHRTSKSLRVR